jgi:purine catabolism regulator
LPLREVLELEVIRRTGARLLHGEQQLDRIVRWVHTSELAEVPTLLKGGELLLTSGLGVAAHGPAAQATYVHQLADKRIAALALELGWSFQEVPAGLLDAARERDLPLIALHNIVPFVEITEEIQRRIVFGQAGELSAHHELQAVLNAALLRAEGLTGIVRALAQALGCEVVLRTVSGRVVATTALERVSGEYASAAVSVLGEEWGTLRVYAAPESSAAKVRAALEHGPTAIALTLLRTGRAVPLRQRLMRELLDDLLAGRFMSRRDLEVRAGLLGLVVSSRTLAGVAVGDYLPEQAEAAVHALEEVGGRLVAEVGTVVLGVVTAADGREAAQAQAETLLEHVQARLRTGAPRLALGPAVDGLEAVGHSLEDARRTLMLARELGTANRAATARGMAAERLLAKLAGEDEMAAFVDDEVGALLRYDALHGTDLAGTLWTCLASGASKSEIARSLHLRRQSLYQRLAKIEQLVGAIDDPERRVALTLALKANQIVLNRTPP